MLRANEGPKTNGQQDNYHNDCDDDHYYHHKCAPSMDFCYAQH